MKGKILAIKNAAGNNLAHAILKGDTLFIEPYNLFEVCGIDVFKAKNHQGLTPLQANLGKLSELLDSRHRDGDYHVATLQDALKPLVRVMLPELMDRYIRLQSTTASVRNPHEIQQNLKDTASALGVSVKLSDALSLRSIQLERIDHPQFYVEMANSPEGRKILRDYRVQGKTALYNNFSEHDQITSQLLPIYYEAGVAVPSPREVDVKLGANVGNPSAEFFKAYKNSQGQNMAFLIVRNYMVSDDILKDMNDRGIDVKAMLREKDKSGHDALADITRTINYVDALIDIYPTFLTTPCFKDGTTPLMVLALFDSERGGYLSIPQYSSIRTKLLARGIKIDQKDVVGNTAESIALAKTQYLQSTKHPALYFTPGFFYSVLSKQPLESNLWQTVINHPYSRMLGKISATAFIDGSLNAVLNMTHSPVRSAFLQQNSVEFASQAQAVNQLWGTFFSTYDELERKELYIDPAFADETKLSHPIRVLKIASYFRPISEIDEEPAPQIIQAMQTLQSNILVTGGTFGMNFNRTANEQEAKIILDRLKHLGESILNRKMQKMKEDSTLSPLIKTLQNLNGTQRLEEISKFIKARNPSFMEHITTENVEKIGREYIARPFILEAASEIVQHLFRAQSTLTREQQLKLEDHQTNCAVMALVPVFFDGKAKIYFDEIDQVLASRPLMKYKGAKQRFDDVMKIAGLVQQ